MNFLIPKNSLYNLIDNAINHGILKKNIGGTITLIVSRDIEKIVIEIKDDGVGMEEEKIMKILKMRIMDLISISSSQYKDLYNGKLRSD